MIALLYALTSAFLWVMYKMVSWRVASWEHAFMLASTECDESLKVINDKNDDNQLRKAKANMTLAKHADKADYACECHKFWALWKDRLHSMYTGLTGYRNTLAGYTFAKVDLALMAIVLSWLGLVEVDCTSLQETVQQLTSVK